MHRTSANLSENTDRVIVAGLDGQCPPHGGLDAGARTLAEAEPCRHT